MDREILQSSVRLKFGTGKYLDTRGAVLQEVKGSLPLEDVKAVYKYGEGRDWYVTFPRSETDRRLSDETFLSTSGTPVKVEIRQEKSAFPGALVPFSYEGS